MQVENVKCEELFHEVVTEFGLCCTFNLLPDVTNRSFKNPFPDWDLENGYYSKNPLHFDKNAHLKERPYRSDIAGLNGGLTFTLDLHANKKSNTVIL